MRKPAFIILSILVLFIIIIGTGVFAVSWFREGDAPAITNIEEVRSTLQSLAPTEAEAKAISHLRKKMLAHAPEDTAALPETKDPDAQMRVECRYIFVKPQLAKMIITNPALSWSTLLPYNSTEEQHGESMSHGETKPGMVWAGTYTEMPVVVRFLEDKNIEKFSAMIQSQRQAHFIEAPAMAFFSGQSGSVNDTNVIPFVKEVYPVETDGAIDYVPAIRLSEQGQTFLVQGTVLQDDSCRLEKCSFDHTSIVKVDTTDWLKSEEKPRSEAKTTSRVLVQIPTARSFRVNIPEIVVPKGMSLLMAAPGVAGGWYVCDEEILLFIITPRAVHPPRNVEKREKREKYDYMPPAG